MSRCFPFPPPGYEKKPRLEDPITVKEEKKEKKHKKEKKDREKREGKEKKDKQRSDGKDRDKRDKKEKHKKEKHKDKKDKEKDRGKDKEKRSISETNGAASILGTKIEDKLGTNDGEDNNFVPNEKNGAAAFHRQNGEQNIQCNLLSQDIVDSKFVLELARRIDDEEEVTRNQLERLPGAEKKKEDSRFVLELARRIKDEERVTSNQLERLSGAEKKKDDEGERIPVKSPGNFVVDKGKDKDRHIGDKKMDGNRIRENVKFSENSTVQSFAGTGKSSIGGLPRAAEDNEKRTERKEKAEEKDDKSRNKHKGKDREKKSHRKDRDEEKEKKKAEKAKKKKEDKNTEPDKSKNVTRSESPGRNGPDNLCNVSKSCPVGFTAVMGSVALSDQTKNAAVEGTEKRRKEMDTNEPVNLSNASSGYPVGFTEVIGSAHLCGQRNPAIVIRNEKKRKEIEANAPDNVNDAIRSYTVDFTEVLGSVPLSDDCRNHAIAEGNAKKRKEMDIDGFLYDNEERPNKVRRPSPHQLLENGRKLDAQQSPILFTSENHGGAACSLTVDDKERRKNGLIEAKSVHIFGPNPSVSNDHLTEKSRKTKPPRLEEHILGSNPSVLNDQVIEKSRKTKPPHPDTELLSQILMVPQMDEWSGFDDLEWLSGSQDPPSKKHQVGSAGGCQDLQHSPTPMASPGAAGNSRGFVKIPLKLDKPTTSWCC